MPAERERRADFALAEGAVELLERVAAWLELPDVRTMAQLAAWPGYGVLIALCNVLSYRAPHSPRLAARLAPGASRSPTSSSPPTCCASAGSSNSRVTSSGASRSRTSCCSATRRPVP